MPRVLTIFFSGHQFSWQLQSFVCLGTFSGQAQCFEDMEVKNCKSHWNYEVEVLLHVLNLKEVSQKRFVFKLSTAKLEGCLALAEKLCFPALPFQNWRKSRRFFFKIEISKFGESLAEQLRFQLSSIERKTDR